MFSRKQLIKLLAPLIAEQIMTVLVGMVDVMMVAAVGEAAVSGVSLVDSISVLILQIMGALATGGAVISAQYLGKSEPRNARKAAGHLAPFTGDSPGRPCRKPMAFKLRFWKRGDSCNG